jgi:hypothetical protein
MRASCKARRISPRINRLVTEKIRSVALPVALKTKAMPKTIAARMASMAIDFPRRAFLIPSALATGDVAEDRGVDQAVRGRPQPGQDRASQMQ